MIDVERGSITIVRLAHGKANALDLELCEALTHLFRELRAADDVRAIVLTASGGIFSAGVDLVRLIDSDSLYVRAFLPAMDRAFRSVFFCTKPLITAVNGHAIAGGALLAWCGDVRLMVNAGARIGVPELLVGVPFPPSALEITRFAMPSQHVQRALYTGEIVEPDEALRRGMIDELADPDALLATATARAEQLARLAPRAFSTTKRNLRSIVEERLAVHGPSRDAEVRAVWDGDDTRAAVRAYVDTTLRRSS